MLYRLKAESLASLNFESALAIAFGAGGKLKLELTIKFK